MNVANLVVTIYRKPECVDKYKERLKNCQYESIGELQCVKMYLQDFLTGQDSRVANNLEATNFIWHSCDQAGFINIEKGDYFAYTMGEEVYYHLVQIVRGRPAFRFGKGKDVISYKAVGERKIPRDCPKEIISQYGSNELMPSIPSA